MKAMIPFTAPRTKSLQPACSYKLKSQGKYAEIVVIPAGSGSDMLTEPLDSITSYLKHFDAQHIPVLRRSIRTLEDLKEHEAAISGRTLAAEVLRDPMLALRVLVYLESHRRKSQNHDITTVDRAIMMMGIQPFFRLFGSLPTVEERLKLYPKALVWLLRVVGRAKNAAKWAREFAIARHDIDVDEVTVAALLHEAAEILFWCFAPELMLRVEAMRETTPSVRSVVLQQAVLGISIEEAQLVLARDWHLPELLITLMDKEKASNPRVRTVLLACDLARHSANGWDDPALPDDYAAIAELLHISPATAMQRIGAPEQYWQTENTPEI